MRLLVKTGAFLCALGLIGSGLVLADDNAAARSRGARISLTSANKGKPYNDRWAKVGDMIKDKKPAGPIINKINTAEITVKLAVPLNVTQVGLKSGDYKGGFAMAKDIEISSPGVASKTFTMTQDTKTLQLFPYPAKTDTIQIKVTSMYPPSNGKKPKTDYGTIANVQVLVKDDLNKVFARPQNYELDDATYAMRTVNLDPQSFSGVVGKPRKATEHPYTIWDKQDIAEFKKQIETYPAAKKAYDGIIAYCEKACKNPIVVPEEPDLGTNPKVGAQHNRVATGIANLGIGYALSGNEKYAKEAKRMLLELAAKYEGWPVHQHPKFRHDSSKWSWQRLGDAIWLIPAAWGYDLIAGSPEMTDADRNEIQDHFIMPCVKNIMRSSSIIAAPTNWSVICNAAVMIGSRACGNQEYYDKAVNGLGGVKYMKGPDGKRVKTDLNNGGIYFHLDKGIDDDGMWAEGAIGYQFMAIRGLIVAAEILWHDGVDIYSYRDGRLKLVFDSPIWYCYPGGEGAPAVHDSGSASLFGRDAHLYQYALRRYGDKTYNAILSRITPTFESIYNLFLPACDFKPVDAADMPRIPSIIFPGVGFAISRTGDGDDSKYLFMDYGPNRSHGHADKLNFNLFALGQELFADGGSAWYSTDVYGRYYPFSLAHNTVTANEMSQIKTDGKLVAYGQLGDMTILRGNCDTAIPSAAMDRTMAMSDGRVYDIFMVKSGIPFVFDLPYHSHGKMEQKIADKPWKDYPKDKRGYCYFKDPVAADVDGDWSCSWNVKNGRVDMLTMGEKGSEVIFATTPKGGAQIPTAMIRRTAKETVYACGFDVIAKDAQKTIKSLKPLKEKSAKGYGLVADLSDGGQEILLANFSNGNIRLGAWNTDAKVAFIKLNGGKVTGLYIAGGSSVKGPGVDFASTNPTLIAYRQVKDGLAELVNQGEAKTTVTLNGVAVPDVAFAMKSVGNRGGKATMKQAGKGVAVALAAYSAVELAKGTQPTVAQFEQDKRVAKVKAQLARLAAEKKAVEEKIKQQYADAEKNKTSKEQLILIEAEAFTGQGGGKVGVSDKKAAIHGSAFAGWNDPRHWLEYEINVPETGYYQLGLKYCREGGDAKRGIMINGKEPFKGAMDITFAGTGGWSNGADNWEIRTIEWPLVEKPFLFKLNAGKNVIKLVNISGGGVNLDYLVLASPGKKLTKKAVEKK